MKIIWAPLAIDRAAEIVQYISYDNPAAASKWIDNLFKKVEILKSAPEIGRMVPEMQRKDIRELIFGNYRIIYRLEKGRICILTVRHGKQILPVDEIMA
jgi:toxin ParE1/3/4